MSTSSLLPAVIMGAVASARSMMPMAAIATARLAGQPTPGRLLLLDQPLFAFGAIVLGFGELFGDKMKSAPDRTVRLGLLARVLSAGIAGVALAPRGRERAGAAAGIVTAVPLAYVTLAGRMLAMRRFGPTRSGFVEDALVVAAAAVVMALAVKRGRSS